MTTNKGTSIIFLNSNNDILLMLRDNIPSIRYPNCWDLIGGHFEENETPEKCIIRETKEEVGRVVNPTLFKVMDMGDRIEHTFWTRDNFKSEDITLHEGQMVKWFTEDEIKNISEDKIAFNFKVILLDFYKERPFDK